MNQFTLEECNRIMKAYDLPVSSEVEMIDSSRGDQDIRHNYILDHKYVLRVNSTKALSEDILKNLNRLIHRYNDFGVRAPLFLEDPNGIILHQDNEMIYYVSEYLDGMTPSDEMSEEQEATLVRERLQLISSFAAKYKNVGLLPFMSMYSIIELSPDDELIGMDEKQANLNQFVQVLRNCGEEQMADHIEKVNEETRDKLLRFYKELPRCSFQGDENWQNLIIDEKYHIQGLFDFNMAGTDVIVNYFANNALLEPDYLDEEHMTKLSAAEIFQMTLDAFRENTKVLEAHYNFSEMEKIAYTLYARIVLISAFPNVCAFRYFLQKEEYKEKAKVLLGCFADSDLAIF